jgi:Ras-related protein Rab-8A
MPMASATPTTPASFYIRQLKIDSFSISLEIWDTPIHYPEMVVMYFRGAAGMIFVYDIMDRDDFNSIDYFIKRATPNVCLVLVGNKIDFSQQRKVRISIEFRSFSTTGLV